MGHKLRGLFSAERQEDLQTLKDLIEAGRLTPVVDRTHPLADTCHPVLRAWRRKRQGRHHRLTVGPGRCVLRVFRVFEQGALHA